MTLWERQLLPVLNEPKGEGRNGVVGEGGRGEGGVEGERRKGGGVGGGGSSREEVVHYKFLQGEPLFPNLIPPGYHHGYIFNNTSLEDFIRIDPREVMQYHLHVILNNVLLR